MRRNREKVTNGAAHRITFFTCAPKLNEAQRCANVSQAALSTRVSTSAKKREQSASKARICPVNSRRFMQKPQIYAERAKLPGNARIHTDFNTKRANPHRFTQKRANPHKFTGNARIHTILQQSQNFQKKTLECAHNAPNLNIARVF